MRTTTRAWRPNTIELRAEVIDRGDVVLPCIDREGRREMYRPREGQEHPTPKKHEGGNRLGRLDFRPAHVSDYRSGVAGGSGRKWHRDRARSVSRVGAV